jgi:hypothetical protein
MDADWSVELGPNDETLEYPWSTPDGSVRYYDLKHHPDLIDCVTEVSEYPELRDVLLSLNHLSSPLETAKCDAWCDEEVSGMEYAASHRCGCYIDLLFADRRRLSFEDHEQFVKLACAALRRGDELTAQAEFIVRRCYYAHDIEDVTSGYYVTVYVFGYGDSVQHARDAWSDALGKTLQAQLSAADRLTNADV